VRDHRQIGAHAMKGSRALVHSRQNGG
jgi:hypothetical protein